MADDFGARWSKIKKSIASQIVTALYDESITLAEEIVFRAMSTKGFHDITGNLINSYAAGIYHNGKFMGYVRNAIPRPKMASLKKGQTYPLRTYWAGDAVGDRKPYTGETLSRNEKAHEQVAKYFREHKPRIRSGIYIVLACTMDYAAYVEMVKNRDVLRQLDSYATQRLDGLKVRMAARINGKSVVSKAKRAKSEPHFIDLDPNDIVFIT